MIDIIFHDEIEIGSYNPGQTGGFENAAGSGEIHYYQLFDGVGIMLLRLEIETYTEMRTQVGALEINSCCAIQPLAASGFTSKQIPS